MSEQQKPMQQISIIVSLDCVGLSVTGALPEEWRHKFVDALRSAGFEVKVTGRNEIELEK